MSPGPPDTDFAAVVTEAVTRALAEDLGADGDLTAALVPERATAHFALRARQPGVLAGRACATETFRQLDPALPLLWHAEDGSVLEAGTTVMEVTGPLRPILTGERTALNFLGRLSGIATLTARYVAAAHARNPAVQVLDTRKTTPGLRALEKAAVKAGGGVNHRASLSEAVLVKDNHLAGVTIGEAVGPRPGAVARSSRPDRVRRPGRRWSRRRRAGADAVLLDNMDPAAVAVAVKTARAEAAGPILTEVSGGITLESIGDYAAAGPDRISVGALTHSATVLDLGLDLIWRADAPHGEGD